MFLTANETPVCMCIFMMGTETTTSNSRTSGQTFNEWTTRPSGTGTGTQG